jgi:hypothetical protein
MTSLSELNIAELAALIQDHLRKAGIDVVLTGGAAVGVHGAFAYVSKDIDLVCIDGSSVKEIRQAMLKLGFSEKDRYYVHSQIEFLVDFPAGPLSVGDEPITQFDELQFSTGLLKVLTPTDCVKDRLAAFYHWDDHQALTQAVLVAQEKAINLDDVKAWSMREGMQEKFETFRSALPSEYN